MTEPPQIIDLPTALRTRAAPAVGLWNRLEGRPRTADFGRALRAEVRDPLWLLARQWQLGEFLGSDGGSPVTATYSVATATPSRFQVGDAAAHGAVEPLPAAEQPLEALAERRAVPFELGAGPISFDLRLAIGRHWLKLLRRSIVLSALNFRQQYVQRYPIALPDPEADADAVRVAHPEVWAMMQAVAGRRMDGYLFYRHLKGGGLADDGISDPGGVHRAELRSLGQRLVAWFDGLIDQPGARTAADPGGDAAWDPNRLEHRFRIAAATAGGGEEVLAAREYPGGLLDWHAFSIDPSGPLGGTAPAAAPINRTVFPAPVRFSGMPLPRWWAVEDGRTNFAAVRPDSTDLARLIFLEFALVYSNDWFLLPCDLPAGTKAAIQGLAITDVFGQRLWITPAGAGDDEDWRRWSMFTLDTVGDDTVPADTGLFLPASVPKVAEGPALEEVSLIRDENANMVWGIEQAVRLPSGESRRGAEVAAELVAHRRRLHPPPPPDPADAPTAPVAYEAMNSVPENWIPFIPVHLPGSVRAIRLQRAAMLGEVDGQPVRPRTALLREGLDSTPKSSYFISEEEVPQTGTKVGVAYNRTRWRDGRVVVWLATRRGTGRGEGAGGLAFDFLVDTTPQP
jgi:hypothetical protein